MIDRRSFIAAMPMALIACTVDAEQSRASEVDNNLFIAVHKTPTCGCCNAWIDHLRADGFRVEAIDVPDTTQIADRLGIPDGLRSCHTAEIEGYAIEGHVPSRDIRRLVAERPSGAGLAVPGMPIGSPGMEMSDRRDSYQVLLFDRAGNQRVFASY